MGQLVRKSKNIRRMCPYSKFVAKLVEEVGISSFSNSVPKPIEAHFGESCQQAHGVNNDDCGAGEGVAAGRVRNMEVSGNQPAACENKEFAFSRDCRTKENKEAFAGVGKRQNDKEYRMLLVWLICNEKEDKSQSALEGNVLRTQPLAEQVERGSTSHWVWRLRKVTLQVVVKLVGGPNGVVVV
ncbi:hypothetical protein ACSQ67_014611 [Phaseolus vulgaris]